MLCNTKDIQSVTNST